MKTPPPRLLDDPAAPPQLRDDLRRAAAAPIAYDSAAGLASLQSALLAPPPSAAPPATEAAAATGTGIATKLAITALGSAALIATATFAWSHFAPRPQRAPTPALAPTLAPALAPAPTLAPAPAPTPTLTPAPAPALTPAQLPARSFPPDTDGRLRREIAQLAKIKALLPAHPADAYRLAQAGNREFARGMLVQEREGIAVLALAQLGREREASARARVFLERFPDSPLRERMAQIAGRSTR